MDSIVVEVEGLPPMEFPADTPDDVIDRVVKRELGLNKPQGVSRRDAPNPRDNAIIEPALTMASSIPAAVSSGASGLAAGLYDELFGSGEGSKAGAAVQKSVQDMMTYTPKTPEGQGGMESVADVLQPAAAGLEYIEKGAGGSVLDATGSPALATAAHSAPTAILEALGLGAAKPILNSVKSVPKLTKQLAQIKPPEVVDDIFRTIQTPAKKQIAERIIKGEAPDSEVARYSVVDAYNKGARLKRDNVALKAIGAGLDEGSVAVIKGSNPSTRAGFRKMLNIAEQRLNNKRFGGFNRPSDVVGDVLVERVKYVDQVRRNAGSQLDNVAKSLKGKTVEFDKVVQGFVDDLMETLGVRVVNGKPDFTDSTIRGIAPSERVVKTLIEQMRTRKVPDAYGLHQLKKFIDENVDYAKRGEGLSGKTEGVTKRLRHNIDQLLDANFPKYKAVNDVYAETKTVLDSMQDAAGKKLKFDSPNAEKAAGVLLRRLLSNVQSRANLMNAINDVDRSALKFAGSNGKLPVQYGKGRFDQDIMSLVIFADDLDTLIKPAASTSLAGEVAKGARSGARDPKGAAIDAIFDRAFSTSPEDVIKSIRPLLND